VDAKVYQDAKIADIDDTARDRRHRKSKSLPQMNAG